MACLMKMEIAGITFSVTGRERMTLDGPPAEYLPFLRESRSSDRAADMEISLELNNLPDTTAMTKIFDTAQSWSMFRDEEDYFVELTAPPPDSRPVWLARIDQDFKKASVFCGDTLIRRESGATLVSNPVLYPLDQILFIYIMSRSDGALLHASGVGIGSKGYIFPGRSGAGKSTISGQFALADTSRLLSDDRVAARKTAGGFRVFGTPWAGEAKIASDSSLPLGGIFFLRHAHSNRVREMKPAEAMESLIPVASVPWYDVPAMSRILSLCEDLVNHVPAYELHFRPDREVVDFLENFISSRR